MPNIRPMIAGLGMAGLAAAMLSSAAAFDYSSNGPSRGEKRPRPKSTHKRKFKGSKAAKKASRK